MKRKRVNEIKKYKCRFRGCKCFRDNVNEFFCKEHREYVIKIQNADDIFYSVQNTLYIPEEISVYIFILNVPHLDIIRQIINENSRTRRMINIDLTRKTGQKEAIRVLSRSDIRDIHKYIFDISLISKIIEKKFKDAFSKLYHQIFVLDSDNMVIPYRNKAFREYGGKNIMTDCALLAKSNKDGEFKWTGCAPDIVEYYKLRLNALHIQAEATKAKNIAEKKRDEIYLDLISKTKTVIIKNRIL